MWEMIVISILVLSFVAINYYLNTHVKKMVKKKFVRLITKDFKNIDCIKSENGSYKLTFDQNSPGFLVEISKFNPELFSLKSLRIIQEDPKNKNRYLSSDGIFVDNTSLKIWFRYFDGSGNLVSLDNKILISWRQYEPTFKDYYWTNEELKIYDFEIQGKPFKREIHLYNDYLVENYRFVFKYKIEDYQIMNPRIYLKEDYDDLRIISYSSENLNLIINFETTCESLNHYLIIEGSTIPVNWHEDRIEYL